MEKLSKTQRGLVVAVFAAIMISGCSKKANDEGGEEKKTAVPVEVAEVKRDSIDRIISATGVLFPVDQANVMPKISAPVKSFSVKRGDHVRAGQLVAVLENKDLAAAVADSKAGYEQAQSTLRQTAGATVPEDVTKAQQDMQAARQAMEAAQKVYESRKQLFDQGALARRLVDESNVAYVQARSTFEVAQRHLQAVQNVSRVEQVKGAEAQAQSAKAKYEGAEAQLGYSEVRSPIAGVIADRPLYAGEMASAGTPLLTVVNISQIIARANVPVAQAAMLRIGMPATISQTDATLEAQGKVTVVSPAVDPNSTTIEVWVEAANPGERFKPGATVKVDIHAQTIKDAIVVPTAAILPAEEGGVQVLAVGADMKAHQKKIEIGVREPDKVQITKGLDAGEKVITVGGVGLDDGTPVTIKTGGEDKDEKGDKDKDEKGGAKDKGDKSDKDDKSDKK